MYLNKVTIIGNLTRDPEIKSLPSGVMVASLSVATNRFWKDSNGQKQEQVEYHNIVAFGKQAETIAQYMKKGHNVLIEGRLQTRSWEVDNKKQYRTEIVLEQFQFGSKSESKPTETKEVKQDPLDNFTSPDEDGNVISVDDIPFN
jgi:single-strand DNA-binding protein